MLLDLKLENEILVVIFPKNLVITALIAKQMVEERLAFQKGADCHVLIDLNGAKFDSSEARNVMKNEGIEGIKSAAFIIHNPVENMIIRFFLTFEAPSVPSKVFFKSKRKEAFEWLIKFSTQN